MSTHRDEHVELCAARALGSLDAADARELDAHLAGGCAECESALADFAGASALVAASAGEASVPAGSFERVRAAVRAAGPPRREGASGGASVSELRPARPTRWPAVIGWAVAASLALVTVLSHQLVKEMERELEVTREHADQATKSLDRARAELRDGRRWLEVMSAPEARVAEIALTPQGVAALRGRAVYDPRTRSAVLVFANMTVPAGQDYQLWALRPEGVSNLGLIVPDDAGVAVIRLTDVGEASTLAGFAVSLEPAGGSPNPAAPSGPVVMAGRLGA